MVDERRMREARVKKGGAKEKDSWRGRVRGWRQRGRSTVSRVSVITVSVFSGVNSCIWPWHLPDPPTTKAAFPPFLRLPSQATQFSNSGITLARLPPFVLVFFPSSLCVHSPLFRRINTCQTRCLGPWNLFQRVIFTFFFSVEYLFFRRSKRRCWKKC